jgi:putative tRNA adenosine deaminase-associated protein
VPYFAAIFAHTDNGWIGAEAELTDALGMDDIIDLLREAAVEATGDTVLLLVEEDDEWFGVVRLDGDDDPRAFLSDERAGRTSGIAALLAQFVDSATPADAEDSPDGDLLGDPELLQDLGLDAARLADLSESSLPGDALLVVAEHAGFADEFDRLRD